MKWRKRYYGSWFIASIVMFLLSFLWHGVFLNDINKVTELLGRHKTLPLPSIVKITNLENGLSLTIKIVDRHNDNASIIQVSRKVAQLLRFYKNKITKAIPNRVNEFKSSFLDIFLFGNMLYHLSINIL